MKRRIVFWAVLLALAIVSKGFSDQTAPAPASAAAVDLLARYPTKLSSGDTAPEHARAWEFTSADVFRLSEFNFTVGTALQVKSGPADLGIGHCADGALWAVVLPRDKAELSSSASEHAEPIRHVWLRFHPGEIDRLFPPATVFADGGTQLVGRIRATANARMTSSWQAGGRAMIPNPKDLTLDMDTESGPRRFFVVDTEAKTAEYVDAFAERSMKLPPPVTAEAAAAVFDKIWNAFDEKYAMFVLRPEVDWAKLREQYRPRAVASQSAYELAGVCAEMLANLRDLHIWLKLSGNYVPVFNRPRSANANPRADSDLLGGWNPEGRIAWAVTTNKIGYLAIFGWDNSDIPKQCDDALEQMRDTRGLIVDVRLNGGGDEPTAEEVAGRFLTNDFVYACDQFRAGAGHTNLTDKIERSISPRGPWRYNRPVVLLIGQKCMSSNESFVGMMTGDPDLVTMGDHTCGSSGNPEIIDLPLDMTVSVPRWIDYLPDGKTPLDERGFRPDIWFKPSPGAFDGDSDELLTAALTRLASAALPEKPIAGPVADQ